MKLQALCMILASAAAVSAASGQVIKSWTYANKTGTDANDFHIKFDTNASPPTPAPMRTSHSNDVQDNTGNSRGTWPRPTASGSNPGGNLTTNILDYAGATPMVRNGDQFKVTIPFPGRNPGKPNEVYFTLNGTRIAGRVDQIALNESFNQDATGLCSLDLSSDPGSPAYTASNIRVWTGLTSSEMLDYDLLPTSSALSLGSVSLTDSSPAHFSLGSLPSSSFSVITYDLSYFDADIGSSRVSANMVYGSAVPTPASLALSSIGALLLIRRRRA